MEIENVNPTEGKENLGKRERDEEQSEIGTENDDVLKKQKVDVESIEDRESVGPVGLGPKTFGSSMDMFNYFNKFINNWAVNVRANKGFIYEYLVLLDLIKKGRPEPDKIGSGVDAFEIRYHPMYDSRCFFVIREDNSVEDFSFRKCVDRILPLPENMKMKSDAKGGSGGYGSGKKGGSGCGGRGGGRGRNGRCRR